MEANELTAALVVPAERLSVTVVEMAGKAEMAHLHQTVVVVVEQVDIQALVVPAEMAEAVMAVQEAGAQQVAGMVLARAAVALDYMAKVLAA